MNIHIPQKQTVMVSFMLMCLSSIASFTKLVENNSMFYNLKYFFVFFFLLVLFASTKNKATLNRKEFSLVFIVTSYQIFTLAFSNFNLLANIFYLLITFVILYSSFFLFSELENRIFLRLLICILLVIVFFVTFPSIMQMNNFNYFYIQSGRTRFIGNFLNSNELARFCMLGVFLCLRFISKVRTFKIKLLNIIILVLNLYIIYLTDSRACIMISILAIVLYVFLKISAKLNKKILYLAYVSILVMTILLVYYYLNKLNVDVFDLNALSSNRIDIWKGMLSNKSLIELLFGQGLPREGISATAVITNGYFEILAYYGIIGLFFWIYCIGYLIKRKFQAIKKKKRDFFPIAIIFLFLVYYLLEGGLVSLGNLASIYFWMELGYVDK